jgi:hypothetical protein
MASNARSERTKLIMEAGHFPNLHDAVTKFITVESDSIPQMFSLQIREKITTTVTTIIDKIFRIVEAIRIKEIIITDDQIMETGVINKTLM